MHTQILIELVAIAAAATITVVSNLPTRVSFRRIAILICIGFVLCGAILGELSVVRIHGVLLMVLLVREWMLRTVLREAQVPMVTASMAFREPRPDPTPTRVVAPAWLTHVMRRDHLKAGEAMFRAGDLSDEIFVIVKGTVRVVDVGITMQPGDMVGEIGIFCPQRKRTATVVCETDVEVLRLSAHRVFELFCQNPKFAFLLLQLIISRMNNRVRHHVAERQQAERAAEAERQRARQSLADAFDASAADMLANVRSSVAAMGACSERLTAASGEATRESTLATEALARACAGSAALTEATEGLFRSLDEIGRRIRETAAIAGDAVGQNEHAQASVAQLAEAAEKIGTVVELITSIASQTNLLALNATIEAARAGEAGKGFAVVATEVKSLAAQTARATEDITEQVHGIQAVAERIATDIGGVGQTIGRLGAITATITAEIDAQQGSSDRIGRAVAGLGAEASAAATQIAAVAGAIGTCREAASHAHEAIGALDRDADALRGEVGRFSTEIRAA